MSMLAVNLRAAGLIALAMLLYAVSDAFIKHLTTVLPIGEIMGLRGIAMCLLLYALLRRQGHAFAPRLWLHPANLGRAVLEVVCAGLYFVGLNRLPLGDNASLFFIAPIMLTALAALILKEPVGPRRWAAVGIGFLGVVVVAGPPAAWSWAILLPLGSAFFSASRDIATRKVPRAVPAGAVSLVTAAAVMLGGFATLPFGWVRPDAAAIGLLLLSAGIVAIGYQCYVLAIRMGEVSFISPFRYVAVPFSILLGVIFWAETPTPGKLLGASIIVGSGLFILLRERQLARRRG